MQMRDVNYTAVECKLAGYSPEEMLPLCYQITANSPGDFYAEGYKGRVVISEGKFGVITAVWSPHSYYLKIKFDDGTKNTPNYDGGPEPESRGWLSLYKDIPVTLVEWIDEVGLSLGVP